MTLFDTLVWRDLDKLGERLHAYGIESPNADKLDVDTYENLHCRGDDITLLYRDAQWEGDLPLTPDHFKNDRAYGRYLKKTSGKFSVHCMYLIAARLRADHVRVCYLPFSVRDLISDAAKARRTLTELCSHADAPADVSAALAHARMVEDHIHGRAWAIGDLPEAGRADVDVTCLQRTIALLQAEVAESVRVCAQQGPTMVLGAHMDDELLSFMERDSILCM